jgi:hypothetical protein
MMYANVPKKSTYALINALLTFFNVLLTLLNAPSLLQTIPLMLFHIPLTFFHVPLMIFKFSQTYDDTLLPNNASKCAAFPFYVYEQCKAPLAGGKDHIAATTSIGAAQQELAEDLVLALFVLCWVSSIKS